MDASNNPITMDSVHNSAQLRALLNMLEGEVVHVDAGQDVSASAPALSSIVIAHAEHTGTWWKWYE